VRALRNISIAIAFCLLSVLSIAQQADATLSPNEILIGEQAVMTLSVSYDKSSMPEVEFPQFGDTLITDVEIVRQTDIDTLSTADDVTETRIEKKLYLTSWDTGFYAIPPFQININGEIQNTEAFLLTVKTVEIDTTAGIKPPAEIYEVDLGWQDYLQAYWYYPAGALALAGLIVAVILLVRAQRKRRAEKPIIVKAEPLRPADEIAKEQLEEIQREKIYKKGKVKQYHTEITDVLRDYLERVYDIPAHELTSNEIMNRLRYVGLTDQESRQLRVVMNRADMVKFAKDQPDEQENEDAVKQSLAFVESTAARMLADKEINE
jgi:hypothetical protein